MFFSFTLSIDKNVVKIYNNKNVKFLCQDLIDVVIESGQYIEQSERHYLILKVAIVDSESRFLFIIFSDHHLMISIG